MSSRNNFFEEERTVEDVKMSCGIDNYEVIKMLAAESYGFFLEHVLGANVDSPVIKEAVKVHSNRPVTSERGSSKVVVEAPRGHSKTFSWTKAPALWIAYKGSFKTPGGEIHTEGVELLLVSSSLGQAIDILRDMKRIIVRNEMLQHLEPSTEHFEEFGEDQYDIKREEKEWRSKSITTTTDVSIKVKPFTSRIRGKHIDAIFLDDVLSDNKSNEKEKQIFYEVISPIVENRKGYLQLVGTPSSHDDLIEELMGRDSIYYTNKFKAIKDDGEPLWPWKWNIEGLKQKKREIGPTRFSKEYMCDPIAPGEQFFDYEKCVKPVLDESKEYYKINPNNREFKDWRFYVALDVALGDKKDSDFNVWTVIGVDSDQRKYLVDIVRKRVVSPEKIKEMFYRLYDIYGFEKAYFEKNAQGEGLKNILKTSKLGGLIEPFDTTGKSRPKILSNLQAEMFSRKIVIPYHEVLLDELKSFKNRNGKLRGGKHDDIVMSLAICNYAAGGGDYTPVFAEVVSGEETTEGLGDDDDMDDIQVGII